MEAGSSAKRRELAELAHALLDIVPLVTRSIRAEMRAQRNAVLSVPQFRVLNYVAVCGPVSLSDVAEHMGLTLASVSKMIDALVDRRFVVRAPDETDRRKVAIVPTPDGKEAWNAAREAACASIARRLEGLSDERFTELSGAFATLRVLFSSAADTPAFAERGKRGQ